LRLAGRRIGHLMRHEGGGVGIQMMMMIIIMTFPLTFMLTPSQRHLQILKSNYHPTIINQHCSFVT